MGTILLLLAKIFDLDLSKIGQVMPILVQIFVQYPVPCR
jgi:hypothetical protein